MKIAVCYVHPNLKYKIMVPAARRFVRSYLRHPPGEVDHQLWILVNGTPLNSAQEKMFDPLPFRILNHDNTGKDIGAFQKAAVALDCDLIVCLGAFVHFSWTGWLDRIVQVVEDCGPTLYGAWGFHQPALHIRTTAFWLPRELFNEYPFWVSDPQRYEFEHGKKSIARFVLDLGLEPLMVSRREVLGVRQWRHLNEQECILLDQHTDRIGYSKE